MRAAVLEDISRPLTVRAVPEPDCPADGAVIQVEANGICRTDWALWSGQFWRGGPTLTPPFVLGHEFAGAVVEVGPDVRDWMPGARVTFPMNPGDGTCATCRSGQQQVCEHFDTMVPGVSHWGAFAEFVAVRHADVNLVALPDSLTSRAAASLGCRYVAAFHAIVDQARTRGGEWVAVYGAGGGMGSAAVQIATAIGAQVVAVDVDERKLRHARALGAVHVVDSRREDPAAAVRDLTGGGAHVSIDAVGLAQTCVASVHSLRIRGRHVQLGHTTPAQRGRVALPIDVMMIRELEFLSAFGMAAHRFPTMMAMIESGRLDPGALVTESVDLAGAGTVLESMATFTPTGIVVIDAF